MWCGAWPRWSIRKERLQSGIIALFDDRGLKVDGVFYTRAQASREGWTLVF
ncbi:MAG: hypothetical protein HWD60_14970 [Defluviicoccus sp.]|nr:MAG: hypothetical protein HWD60_14970 [Defluviicoccus sp.]